MSIFEYVKNLFRRLILKIIKKKKVTKEVVLTEEQKVKFDRKQQKVIMEGLKLGLDIKRIAKKKYSAEQMVLLMYGLTMGLDISKFDSFTMAPLEMEYHLYMEAVNKYLGKNYLKSLLCDGENSVADQIIQDRIREDLIKSLALAFNETASTLLEEEIVESHTEEDIFYEMLLGMCKDRNIDSSSLKINNLTSMEYEYEQLEKQYAQTLDKRCIGLKKIQNYSMEPPLSTILKGREIESRVSPIKLYSQGKLVNEFYQVNSDNHIYLYREKYITIKIR